MKKEMPGRDCNTVGRIQGDAETRSHENTNSLPQKKSKVKFRGGGLRMDESVQQKPGFWAVLPAAVRYDPELPPNAKLLYAEISSLTDRTGFCFASNAYFQSLYGISERTVQNLLRALQKKGYIRIADGDGGSGRRKIFAGVNTLTENPAEICGVTPQKFAGIPAEICGGNKKENKKEKNTPQSPPGGGGLPSWEPEMFSRFWEMYPKKKDKKAAVREWDRLRADRKLMGVMSAALGTQMASEEWQRDNGRAIPYPCRWLSHRRWEDETEVRPRAAKPRALAGEDEWLA